MARGHPILRWIRSYEPSRAEADRQLCDHLVPLRLLFLPAQLVTDVSDALEEDARRYEALGDQDMADLVRDLKDAVLKAGSDSHTSADLTVFLEDTVTPSQEAAIKAALEGAPGVNAVVLESKEEAWARFRDTFAANPELVDATDPDALPASYRVTLEPGSDRASVASTVKGLAGVDEVITNPLSPYPAVALISGRALLALSDEANCAGT